VLLNSDRPSPCLPLEAGLIQTGRRRTTQKAKKAHKKGKEPKAFPLKTTRKIRDQNAERLLITFRFSVVDPCTVLAPIDVELILAPMMPVGLPDPLTVIAATPT